MASNAFDFDKDVGQDEPSRAVPENQIGVLKIGKREYAVDLLWNGIPDPTTADATAREQATSSTFNANFYCIKQGTQPQFGVGYRHQGHKSNMPALAAHIAASRGGSFLAAFAVGGGYYVLAVRDDQILSDCEAFYDKKEDALSVFEDHLGMDWNEIIAPDEFGIDEARPLAIEDILVGKPTARLKDVNRSGNLIKYGVLLLIAVGVIVGSLHYLDLLERERLEEEMRLALERAQSVVPQQEETIEVPPMPWEGKIMGAAALEACVESIMAFPLDFPGWTVSEFRCDAEQSPVIAAVLDRDGSLGSGGAPLTWVERLARKDDFQPQLVMAPTGSNDRISLQWGLNDLPIIPVDLETEKVGRIRDALVRSFEQRFHTVSFADADSNNFWRGTTFDFSTELNPMEFHEIVAAVPGVIIENVSFDVGQRNWTIRGKAYEQLPLPEQPVAN